MTEEGGMALGIATKDIVGWAQRFVRHPSPVTDLFEQEPQVQNLIADVVMPLAQELELPHRRDPMGNLLIEIGPTNTGRSLMLMAYAMTHPGNRMATPFAGELIGVGDDAMLRGRGVSEQKGSLAAALAATKAAARDGGLKGRLVLTVSTAGETGRHDAAISVCDTIGFMPRAALIVIGTTSRVALANKGRVDVIVTVRGRASHSSTPWVGVNAIDGARRVLDSVAAVDVGDKRHDGLGTATLTSTAIRSWPDATHTVQDEVRLIFDRRLLPGDDPQAAFAAVAKAADIGGPWQVEAIFGPFMHPAEVSETGSLVSAIVDGCQRMGLPRPEMFHSHGALDAGYFCARGTESVMWGPGNMDQWHSNDERIAVRDLIAGANGYLGLINAYLRD
jgi:acetylornithine deacetylase